MTLTHSIGTAGGRDYASIEAWEQAWDIALPGKRIGEVYHDGAVGEPTYALLAGTDKITIAGATGTNATTFRELRAAAGHQYDPHLRTGVWIKRQCGVDAVKAGAFAVGSEPRVRIETMAVIDDVDAPKTSGFGTAIEFNGMGGGVCNRCYVEFSSMQCNGVDGTAVTTGIEVIGTSVNINNVVTNCIVVGGGFRGNRGMVYGIRYQNAKGAVVGCTVADVVGWNTSTPGSTYGINTHSDVTVYNCISVSDLAITAANINATNINFASGAARGGLITSDVTAVTYTVVGVEENQGGVVKSQLFISHINRDYRLLSSAPAQDWLKLQHLYDGSFLWRDFLDYDYAGNTRSLNYADLGALDGAVTGVETAPTRVISTIGVGGDYADPQAWEAATDIDLVTANTVHIGEMLGNFNDASSSALVVSGALTDSVRYRELRPAAANQYKPTSETGCVISTSGTSAFPVVSIEERFFRLTGPMKVTATNLSTTATTGEGAVVYAGLDADGTVLNALYITIDTAQAACSFFSGILARHGQNDCLVKNCVVYGHNGADNRSVYAGIRVRDSGNWKIYNNSIFGTKISAATTDQNGIKVDTSVGCEIRNNIVIDCKHASGTASSDYSIGSTPTASCSNNISSDATAPGVDSLTSKTAANTWVNAVYRNYYLKAGTSEASRAGMELIPTVKLDAHLNGRFRPFDIGALEGAKPYPQFPASQRRRQVCHCYEIIRRDGVRLLFTDNNTPIDFLGDSWSPVSMDATARRKELGMRPADLSASGGISSDRISYADLRTGRYQGARLVEYLVDPSYPHLKPMAEARYTIESTTFDGEQWNADVKGLPFILQSKVGDVFGRTCRYVLGDSGCRANITGMQQTGKAVLDVVDKRLSFYVADATLSSVVTNYYGLGKLTWLTGNNAGVITELFGNERVRVNALAAANTLLESNANWTGSAVTTTQVSDGFSAGVHSFNANLDGVTGYLTQSDLGGSETLWSDFAPVDTKVCFSIWIKTRSLANPATGTCEVKLLDIGTASDNEWTATFKEVAGAWTVQSVDTGVTAEVTGGPIWFRLSVGRYALGDEIAKIGAKVVINGVVNEDAEFSQAQVEVDVLTPTSWTVSTKHKLQLALRADADIADTDTFDLDPGCDKLLGTCKSKFGNQKNFGGFPYIPGVDKMFDTPTQ